MTIERWLVEKLACPWDGQPVREEGGRLACACGRTFPVVDGIPVMLRDDVEQTHPAAKRSLELARDPSRIQGAPREGIHPFVQEIIAATNGLMYRPLIGRLRDYPIPSIRVPPGDGKLLLDVGCNWGRWCVAAARRGYSPIGVDPSLEALLAAKHVASQLGVTVRYVVGDARYLPFASGTFDYVFSYSVLQHFSRPSARAAIAEMGRVLREGGVSFVQMANKFGLRCLYHQLRHGFRERTGMFDVRHWTPGELERLFAERVGPAELSVDGYFSLNPQPAEAHLLPRHFQLVVRTSEALRAVSERVPAILNVADSLYVTAHKAPAATA